MQKRHKLTTISISVENYRDLKKMGEAGDSFNDVLTEILNKIKREQVGSGLDNLGRIATFAQTSEKVRDNDQRNTLP